MDINVTLEEARTMMSLLETVPIQSRGTIDEQCVMYANLSSFATKLAVAITRTALAVNEEEDAAQLAAAS